MYGVSRALQAAGGPPPLPPPMRHLGNAALSAVSSARVRPLRWAAKLCQAFNKRLRISEESKIWRRSNSLFIYVRGIIYNETKLESQPIPQVIHSVRHLASKPCHATMSCLRGLDPVARPDMGPSTSSCLRRV